MQETLVRFGLLLAIFASAFIVSQVVLGGIWRNRARFSAVNRRLQMIRSGRDRSEIITSLRKNTPSDFASLPVLLARPLRAFQHTLFTSAVPFTLTQMLAMMAGLFVVLFVVLLVMASSAGFFLQAGTILLLITIAVCAGVILPVALLNFIGQRRRKRVEEQFPVGLDVFVRALRSGHPIASAIELLTNEMEDPIGSEFGIVADEVSYGSDLADALQSMADRWDLEDMRMFVVSLSVQSETGGNLAEILENLSHVIRARAAMYMKVRALSSEGRMTGWMLTVLPIFAFVSMFLVNPAFYLDTAQDPIFIFGFGGLITLYAIGLFAIRRLIDLKV